MSEEKDDASFPKGLLDKFIKEVIDLTMVNDTNYRKSRLILRRNSR